MRFFITILIYSLFTNSVFSQGTTCATAINVPLDGSCQTINPSGQTGSTVNCGYGSGYITWIKFTTTTSSCIKIKFTNSDSMWMEVLPYSSSTCNNNASIQDIDICAPEGYGWWGFDYLNPPIANKTYYLRVCTKNQTVFTACAQVCTPANDVCTGATPIGSVEVNDDNTCAVPGIGTVPELTPNNACAFSLENTLIYDFYVVNTGNVVINVKDIHCVSSSVTGSNAIQIALSTGSCSALTPIPANCTAGINGIWANTSFFQFTSTSLQSGTHVYMTVDGSSGANCSYTISGLNISPVLVVNNDNIVQPPNRIPPTAVGKLIVINALGQVVWKGNGRVSDIPKQSLPQGVYIVSLDDGMFIRSQKFIKQ